MTKLPRQSLSLAFWFSVGLSLLFVPLIAFGLLLIAVFFSFKYTGCSVHRKISVVALSAAVLFLLLGNSYQLDIDRAAFVMGGNNNVVISKRGTCPTNRKCTYWECTNTDNNGDYYCGPAKAGNPRWRYFKGSLYNFPTEVSASAMGTWQIVSNNFNWNCGFYQQCAKDCVQGNVAPFKYYCKGPNVGAYSYVTEKGYSLKSVAKEGPP